MLTISDHNQTIICLWQTIMKATPISPNITPCSSKLTLIWIWRYVCYIFFVSYLLCNNIYIILNIFYLSKQPQSNKNFDTSDVAPQSPGDILVGDGVQHNWKQYREVFGYPGQLGIHDVVDGFVEDSIERTTFKTPVCVLVYCYSLKLPFN